MCACWRLDSVVIRHLNMKSSDMENSNRDWSIDNDNDNGNDDGGRVGSGEWGVGSGEWGVVVSRIRKVC